MTKDELKIMINSVYGLTLPLAEDFNEWLEDMSEKYKWDKDDIQELIRQFLITPKHKTGWIPVSERLPKDGQHVLFCDIDNDIMVGYHVKGRPDTHFSQDGTYEDMKNVRAWMPLPEPHKTESEDKE